MTFPAARGQLARGDMKVTENGRPVTSLSVQSAAAANGIGTVLLIDSSNSMRGRSTRRWPRRVHGPQPGSAALGRLLQREAESRAAVDDGSRPGPGRPSKPPKLAEGTHIYDALSAAVRLVRGSALGASRRLLSDGDDVGSVTSRDSASSSSRSRTSASTRSASSPGPSARSCSRRSPTTRAASMPRRPRPTTSPRCTRARLPARERVPSPLQVRRRSGRERRREHHRRRLRRPGLVLLRPRARERRRRTTAFRTN